MGEDGNDVLHNTYNWESQGQDTVNGGTGTDSAEEDPNDNIHSNVENILTP